MGKVLKIGAAVVAVLLVGAVAFWASQRKPDIPYAELQKTYGAAADRYLDLPDGHHVRYRDQGKADGPVVVLVHGYYMSLETWEPWVKTLGASYRVITLDLPGHGLTRGGPADDADFLEAFAKAKGLERFALGGSSMGGGVAWRYALKHPERVKGLILVDASGWPQKPDPKMKAQLDTMRNPMMRSIFKDFDRSASIRTLLGAAYADPKFAKDGSADRQIAFARAPGHRDILLDLWLDFDKVAPATNARLAAIKVPVLIIHGGRDALIPVDSSKKFAAAIPGSTLIVYPGVGHLPAEEAAAVSATDASAFLTGLEPKKPAPKKPSHRPAIEAKDPNAVIFY